ncbi:MAG: 50S ribosomal protein L25 [Acidobacteriota bacterium]
MAQQFIEIEVERREVIGKKARRATAEIGMIPGIVYGGEREPVPISVDPKKIIQILRSEKGANSILLFSLKGTGSQRHVMIKDFQIDPVSNDLVHADFTRILMDKKVRVKVPIVYDGVAFGVKNESGLVDVIMREVEVECLPTDIPDRIHVDLTPLKVGDSVKIQDLTAGKNVQILAEDPHLPVVQVEAPRVEVEKAEEQVPGEGAQEPEVIGKGKKATEEEGEGGKD